MENNKTVNKIFTGVITALVISVVGTWYNNDVQTKKNAENISSIKREMQGMDAFHNARLDKLEASRESLNEIYVTRREFNKVIELQNEKMDQINKNVEKLLDLELKK